MTEDKDKDEPDYEEQRRRFAKALKRAPLIAARMRAWEHSILGSTPGAVPVTLDEWYEEYAARLAVFHAYWNEKHKEDPEKWPISLLLGDWDEQLRITEFDEELDRDILGLDPRFPR